MPLLELWESNPEAVSQYTIEQIVNMAGDGNLTDGSVCSNELTAYMKAVPSEKLASYVAHCLVSSFSKSGAVLQDVVNELGRRLNYEVENGLYQGRTNAIGFDGIWEGPDGHTLVIEVKTTDAYRINLDTIARYRTSLIEESRIITPNSSILIVVGRQDTGDIEAQVRGSKHAWDVRLISADALITLVRLKESTEEDATVDKMRSLLIPFEYTRLDNIIDVMFATAVDVEAAVEEEIPIQANDEENATPTVQVHTPQAVISELRSRIIEAIGLRENVKLIAHQRATFWSSDRKVRVVCPVSNKYEDGGYWYGFSSTQDVFLSLGETSFFVLGCVGLGTSYAIPWSDLHEILEHLNVTTRENGSFHWHIHLGENNNGRLSLIVHQTAESISLTPYELPITSAIVQAVTR